MQAFTFLQMQLSRFFDNGHTASSVVRTTESDDYQRINIVTQTQSRNCINAMSRNSLISGQFSISQ